MPFSGGENNWTELDGFSMIQYDSQARPEHDMTGSGGPKDIPMICGPWSGPRPCSHPNPPHPSLAPGAANVAQVNLAPLQTLWKSNFPPALSHDGACDSSREADRWLVSFRLDFGKTASSSEHSDPDIFSVGEARWKIHLMAGAVPAAGSAPDR